MRMSSFMLSLSVVGFTLTPALADGTRVEQKASGVAMPAPQSSVAVSLERGVRVWRPVTSEGSEGYAPQTASTGTTETPQYAATNNSTGGYGTSGTFGSNGIYGSNGSRGSRGSFGSAARISSLNGKHARGSNGGHEMVRGNVGRVNIIQHGQYGRSVMRPMPTRMVVNVRMPAPHGTMAMGRGGMRGGMGGVHHGPVMKAMAPMNGPRGNGGGMKGHGMGHGRHR